MSFVLNVYALNVGKKILQMNQFVRSETAMSTAERCNLFLHMFHSAYSESIQKNIASMIKYVLQMSGVMLLHIALRLSSIHIASDLQDSHSTAHYLMHDKEQVDQSTQVPWEDRVGQVMRQTRDYLPLSQINNNRYYKLWVVS